MSISYKSLSDEAESKYLYFILGVSAASLAYALEHGESPSYKWQYALYLCSVFSWLFSFYFGLQAAKQRLSSANLMANAEHLSEAIQLARKNLPAHEQPQIEKQYLEMIQQANLTLEKNGAIFQRNISWQFSLIAFGALFYMGWRLAPISIQLLHWFHEQKFNLYCGLA